MDSEEKILKNVAGEGESAADESGAFEGFVSSRLKDLEEKELRGSRFALTDKERSDLWASISADLDVVPASGRKSSHYIYWSLALAAAIVAGVFLLTPDRVQNLTPNSRESYIQESKNPFRSENKPMKKTTARSVNTVLLSENLLAPEIEFPDFGIESEEVHVTSPDFVFSFDAAVPSTAFCRSVFKNTDSTNKSVLRRAQPFGYMAELGDNASSKRRGGRMSFSVSSNISGGGSFDVSNNFIKSVATQVGYVAPSSAPQIEQVSETTYSLPLNFAVQVHYGINKRFSVGAGVGYSYLHSKFDGLINKKSYRIKQGIHYVGIPLNAYYDFVSAGNFRFYGNAGAAIEKGVKVTYEMKSYDGTRHDHSHVKGVQFSVNAGIGAEFLIPKSKFGIYIEPNLIYYFDSNIPASIRTDQPLQVEAEVGVRFHLK